VCSRFIPPIPSRGGSSWHWPRGWRYIPVYISLALRQKEIDMRILFRGFAASVLVAVALIAGTAQAAELVVFAAASTKDAVDDIAEAFQAAGHGNILTSYGSSSELSKQIEHGAP